MSVITSLAATPNRIKIVWAYVGNMEPSGVSSEDLLTVLAPPALRQGQAQEEETSSGTTMGDSVIIEMRNLELLERAENGNLTAMSGSPGFDERELRACMECRLLHPVNAGKYRQRSFPLALAWLLIQSPYDPLEWGQNYREQVISDCGQSTESFELTNLARWQQFVYWARYLGFAWRLQAGANAVIPDPTAAIARHLPATSAAHGLSSISGVMSEIADLLPVLEGGTARGEVEPRLPTHRQRPEGHLSQSTSFALERLERRGQVRLERLADADPVNLDLRSGLRPISHITWLSGD